MERRYGDLEYEVGFDFPVRGPAGEHWRMAVTYEPGDLFDVWLWKTVGGTRATLAGHRRGVFCVDLRSAIFATYQEALRPVAPAPTTPPAAG